MVSCAHIRVEFALVWSCQVLVSNPACCLRPLLLAVPVRHVRQLCEELLPRAQTVQSHRIGARRPDLLSRERRTRPRSCAAIADSATRTMSRTLRMRVHFLATVSLPPPPLPSPPPREPTHARSSLAVFPWQPCFIRSDMRL